MHDLFRIDELLRRIFNLVDNHVCDRDFTAPLYAPQRDECTLRTLAALARTCYAFMELAEDLLWRELPDLFVLIKYLIPEESLTYHEGRKILVSFHRNLPICY